MTRKQLVESAVLAMRAMVRLARNPAVTRRGNVIIQKFIEDAKEPKPKKKVEEPTE